MRLLFGMILGALLTIGAAYLHDSRTFADSGGFAPASRPMVNWDVVGETGRVWSAWARERVDGLMR